MDIVEHDEALVQNWNTVVTRDDIVYHLGDLGLCHSTYLGKILNRLNGSIHIILGNHDKTALQISKTANVKRFASISDSKYIRVENQHIFLLHYAMRTWRSSYHGSWHLFGHSHGRMAPFGKSFDVGVDCWDYKPVSFDCVKQKMDQIDLIPFGDENVEGI